MIILIDPEAPDFSCYCAGADRSLELRCASVEDLFPRLRESFGTLETVDTTECVLYNGGGMFTAPVTLLTDASLALLEKCVALSPEQNELTLRLVRHLHEALPQAPLLLACETAMFSALPAVASTYAIPLELREKGIRRFGGNGLCHAWACREARRLLPRRTRKVISVCLGDRPDIAAFLDGRAIETTVGFSPVEGVVSAYGCGDIDPTIVFLLQASGMSLQEVTRLLSKESGLSALAEKRCTFSDIMKFWEDGDLALPREVLIYGLKKQIGECAASLGGLDALVFESEDPPLARRLIKEISHALTFMGLEYTGVCGGHPGVYSAPQSPVQVCSLKHDKWVVLLEHAHSFLQKEDGNGYEEAGEVDRSS